MSSKSSHPYGYIWVLDWSRDEGFNAERTLNVIGLKVYDYCSQKLAQF